MSSEVTEPIVTQAGHVEPVAPTAYEDYLRSLQERPKESLDSYTQQAAEILAASDLSVMPEANTIRLYFWRGAWYARIGPADGSDPRGIQYGPSGQLESVSAFLTRFAAYLARRGYEFDRCLSFPEAEAGQP
jgi:hypothetical protein